MSKLLPIQEGGEIVDYLFNCPGYGGSHAPYIKPHKNSVGASWSFNGDINKPTFTPSILAKVQRTDKTLICHSFVTEGKIQFLGDCTHPLAGQTVEIPDLNEKT